MRARPLIAFALLLGYGATSVEAVVGELRDGEVHHESPAAALYHTQVAQGEHGHEDAGQQEPEHGPDHQHGTSVDHCTHTHSAGVPVDQVQFRIVACVASVPSESPSAQSDATPGSLFHPPKA